MGSTPSTTTTYTRDAFHGGSWYENDPDELDATLQGYLDDVGDDDNNDDDNTTFPLRALVVPHAGYSYSGPTAAFAYRALANEWKSNNNRIRHVLVLHPSHHVYLPDTCAVSGASVLETPLGNLTVDDEMRQEILALNSFRTKITVMDRDTDEQEHSGEMQYPYIAKAMINKGDAAVLPLMFGSLSDSKAELFGKILAPIIARPDVLCVISSDFCHWGSRFRFQPVGNNNSQDIFQHIQEMDREGMDHIEMQKPGAFAEYLKKTGNTICGRHPISVWLNAVKHNKENDTETLNIKFVRYAQSSRVRSMRDSSVSYASAVARKVVD